MSATWSQSPPSLLSSLCTSPTWSDSGDFKASTLSRRLVSIAQAHKAAGHKSPTSDETVRLVNAGIRRTIGTARARSSTSGDRGHTGDGGDLRRGPGRRTRSPRYS